MITWLYVHAGLSNGSGSWYLFWSGIGSDLMYLTVIGAGLTMLRRHQCSVRWCPRFARHLAGEYAVCRRHHPRIANRAPRAGDI